MCTVWNSGVLKCKGRLFDIINRHMFTSLNIHAPEILATVQFQQNEIMLLLFLKFSGEEGGDFLNYS